MYNIIGGTKRVTADTSVSAGVPFRVFSIHFVSGGTAGVFVLRNGTTASGDIYVTETGSANTGKTVDFGSTGILFEDGLFYDHDSNITFAIINGRREPK